MGFKIAIRADGNSEIGMGHITRCMSIAYALRKFDVQPIFLLSDSYACKLLEQNKMEYKILGINYQEIDNDVDLVHAFVKDNAVSCVLVDSYYASNKYLEKLMNFVNVACIDGLYKYNAEVNLVINYNAAAKLDDYERRFAGKKTKLLIGCKYVPLKPEFWDISNVHKSNFGKKVLLTTGSTDSLNVCGNLLSALKKRNILEELDITVIIGEFFANQNALIQTWEDFQNVHFIRNCDNLMPLMLETNVAVSAAGTTIYELLRMEIPTILFALTDIQTSAGALADKVMWIGDIRCLNPKDRIQTNKLNDIIDGIKDLCFSFDDYIVLKNKCRDFIDGAGAMRIAESIIDLV